MKRSREKISKMSKEAVVLLSGGVDSVTTLYFAKKKGYKVTALIFDYGQRHKKEIECAKKIAAENKIKYFLVKIKLPWTASSLTDKKIKVPKGRSIKAKDIPSTYVAGRNIIFLSYAFSLAESIAASKVFIGAHTQDYSGYPDCRPQFIKAFEKAVRAGLKNRNTGIVAPLIDKSKKDIIRLGIKLGVPFEHTWSCYEGGKHPCLECDSCRYRLGAFDELGMQDPLLKKS